MTAHESISDSDAPARQSPEAIDLVRPQVRALLARSAAYAALPEDVRRTLAEQMVRIGTYLAEPEGVRGDALPSPSDHLVESVDFPRFVANLIQGVFHAIVDASIEQMRAYGDLLADVTKKLDQFRDDCVTSSHGRDHLVAQFPDLFAIDAEGTRPRLRLHDRAAHEDAARLMASLPFDGAPPASLDDDASEARLVEAARRHLAANRQQMLATIVMMGINRIVVTDGRIKG